VLAVTEPKLLRYRLLHVAAWPWTTDLARAFTRLRTLPLRC